MGLLGITGHAAADGPKNVRGEALADCSVDGMALTGFTRTGQCVDEDDDAGSHHICIDMSSTVGGNFCTVTGQDNWCSSEMPCNENQSVNCQVVDWCVCQWAFAAYLKAAGGCGSIQDLKCEAVIMKAKEAYEASPDDPDHVAALACLNQKCGLTDEVSMS